MRYISELKPDIFHLDDVSLRLAPLLFQLGRTLMVLNVHDAEQHFGEHNWRSDLARRLTFKRVSQFILHSSFSRHQFLNRYAVREDSVSMVPLGIYDIYREWLTDEMQEQPKTILFFGRISPYKGIDVYIRAAEIVSAKIPLCRFIIAGRTIRGYKLPVIPELQQGCIFEVHERYLSNNEVARFITQSSMVVCPYLDASQSGVILTAYAFNKPVIATNVGGLPEYVWEGRTGTIVPPNDANALANAIIAALSNKSTELSSSTVYDALRKNELSWTKGAETTVQIYETITRSHR
jgi:glycosyltransferase involved in cell wall biosynthesis